MSLTRRDIADTSIRTIAAFLTSVAVVGAGIGFFVDMGNELAAQQKEITSFTEEVHDLARSVHTLATTVSELQIYVIQLQEGVSTLLDAQENYVTKAELSEILDWVREQKQSAGDP